MTARSARAGFCCSKDLQSYKARNGVDFGGFKSAIGSRRRRYQGSKRGKPGGARGLLAPSHPLIRLGRFPGGRAVPCCLMGPSDSATCLPPAGPAATRRPSILPFCGSRARLGRPGRSKARAGARPGHRATSPGVELGMPGTQLPQPVAPSNLACCADEARSTAH